MSKSDVHRVSTITGIDASCAISRISAENACDVSQAEGLENSRAGEFKRSIRMSFRSGRAIRDEGLGYFISLRNPVTWPQMIRPRGISPQLSANRWRDGAPFETSAGFAEEVENAAAQCGTANLFEIVRSYARCAT